MPRSCDLPSPNNWGLLRSTTGIPQFLSVLRLAPAHRGAAEEHIGYLLKLEHRFGRFCPADESTLATLLGFRLEDRSAGFLRQLDCAFQAREEFLGVGQRSEHLVDTPFVNLLTLRVSQIAQESTRFPGAR